MSQKRKSFTVEEKCSIIRMLEKGKKNCDVQKELGVSASTIATIWKNREYFRCLSNANCQKLKRRRKCRNIEIEKMLIDWIKEEESKPNYEGRIKGTVLQLKANEFAVKQGINFTCTSSWIQRFRARNGYTGGQVNATIDETVSSSDHLKFHATTVSDKCRLCLIECTDQNAVPLFKDKNDTYWIGLISKYLNLKLKDNDQYSTIICQKCARNLKSFHEFSQDIIHSQLLLQKVQNQVSLLGNYDEMDTDTETFVDIKTEEIENVTKFKIQDLPNEFYDVSFEETQETLHAATEESYEEDPISTFKKDNTTGATSEKTYIDDEKEDNTCEICGIELKNVPTLITHYQHLHKDFKDFKFYTCQVCGLQFSKERVFQQHLVKSKKCSADANK